MVKVYEVDAFGKKSYQQGDMNLAPITQTVPSKSAFKTPKNSVNNGDSSRLQQASKLPGRVSDGNSNSALSS